MINYQIRITPDAENDLLQLDDYISNVLLVPDIALQYVGEIRQAIERLSFFPRKVRLIKEEPWHSRGIRRCPVNNFYIYFVIHEAEHQVIILNVIYAKRDLLKSLTHLPN